MARLINLTTPEIGVTDGMEISFRAPCNCTEVTGISLDGVTYDLVDTSGNTLTTCKNYFVKDAILTVIIDTTNQKATLLNPRVNTYTKTLGTPSDAPNANGNTVWAKANHAVEWQKGVMDGDIIIPKVESISPQRKAPLVTPDINGRTINVTALTILDTHSCYFVRVVLTNSTSNTKYSHTGVIFTGDDSETTCYGITNRVGGATTTLTYNPTTLRLQYNYTVDTGNVAFTDAEMEVVKIATSRIDESTD